MIKDRKCCRCGKLTPRAGLLVNGLAACNSCAPYFREKKKCSLCNSPSSRLSRITGISDEPVCEPCQRKLAFATCSHCGKHRKQHFYLMNRRPICKSCSDSSFSDHICPDCGCRVNGVGDGSCLSCASRRSLKLKGKFLYTVLRKPSVQEILSHFMNWTQRQKKVGPISKRFSEYAQFFTLLDNTVHDSIGDTLIKKTFTAEELRRYGYLTKFLAEEGYLTSSSLIREEWSEQRRIEATLEKCADKSWGEQIRKFYLLLQKKNEKPLAKRTIRLYVHAALSLMEHANVACVEDLKSEHVIEYLRRSPGQRASLHAFVSFLQVEFKVPIEFPSLRKKTVNKLYALDIAELLEMCSMDLSFNEFQAVMVKLLSVLFGVPLKHVLSIGKNDISLLPNSQKIRLDGNWLDIDPRLASIISKFLLMNVSLSKNEMRLFPGRGAIDFLSISSLNYHLSKARKSILKT